VSVRSPQRLWLAVRRGWCLPVRCQSAAVASGSTGSMPSSS